MSLFRVSDKTCCTCEHWEGPRASVDTRNGSGLEGYIFCLGNRRGGCGAGAPDSRADQSCEGWVALAPLL